MFKLYILLFVFGIIGGGGFLAYKTYIDMQNKIVILSSQNETLKNASAEQEEALAVLQENYRAANEELIRVNDAFDKIRQQNNLLSERLRTIDLGLAAESDPEGIEFKVNRGTVNAGRCFELLSGAELTEEEKGSKNAKDFNRECPWLYDDYKSNGMLTKSD